MLMKVRQAVDEEYPSSMALKIDVECDCHCCSAVVEHMASETCSPKEISFSQCPDHSSAHLRDNFRPHLNTLLTFSDRRGYVALNKADVPSQRKTVLKVLDYMIDPQKINVKSRRK
eukprot:TRINITY_DN15658_c0_g1_i1.p1 TRINITY_DN15658_c0_g1~~TRINITY_DN15658_c0_g1_i1.p1  ORF type:complete len:116 (+),score=12.31 TRINITY_DN15658_c0_g1_i1:130-477(+)